MSQHLLRVWGNNGMSEVPVVDAVDPEALLPDPEFDEDEGPSRYARWWWALGALVLVVMAGAAYAFRDNIAAMGAYRYQGPQEFKGMPFKRDDPVAQRLDQAVASGSAAPGAFASSYGTPSMGYVMVVGDEHNDLYPATTLDEAVNRAKDTGIELQHLHSVDPGSRGGAMTCGEPPTERAEQEVVCLWADGSMEAMFTETRLGGDLLTVDQVADDVRAFRDLAEQPV